MQWPDSDTDDDEDHGGALKMRDLDGNAAATSGGNGGKRKTKISLSSTLSSTFSSPGLNDDGGDDDGGDEKDTVGRSTRRSTRATTRTTTQAGKKESTSTLTAADLDIGNDSDDSNDSLMMAAATFAKDGNKKHQRNTRNNQSKTDRIRSKANEILDNALESVKVGLDQSRAIAELQAEEQQRGSGSGSGSDGDGEGGGAGGDATAGPKNIVETARTYMKQQQEQQQLQAQQQQQQQKSGMSFGQEFDISQPNKKRMKKSGRQAVRDYVEGIDDPAIASMMMMAPNGGDREYSVALAEVADTQRTTPMMGVMSTIGCLPSSSSTHVVGSDSKTTDNSKDKLLLHVPPQSSAEALEHLKRICAATDYDDEEEDSGHIGTKRSKSRTSRATSSATATKAKPIAAAKMRTTLQFHLRHDTLIVYLLSRQLSKQVVSSRPATQVDTTPTTATSSTYPMLTRTPFFNRLIHWLLAVSCSCNTYDNNSDSDGNNNDENVDGNRRHRHRHDARLDRLALGAHQTLAAILLQLGRNTGAAAPTNDTPEPKQTNKTKSQARRKRRGGKENQDNDDDNDEPGNENHFPVTVFAFSGLPIQLQEWFGIGFGSSESSDSNSNTTKPNDENANTSGKSTASSPSSLYGKKTSFARFLHVWSLAFQLGYVSRPSSVFDIAKEIDNGVDRTSYSKIIDEEAKNAATAVLRQAQQAVVTLLVASVDDSLQSHASLPFSGSAGGGRGRTGGSRGSTIGKGRMASTAADPRCDLQSVLFYALRSAALAVHVLDREVQETTVENWQTSFVQSVFDSTASISDFSPSSPQSPPPRFWLILSGMVRALASVELNGYDVDDDEEDDVDEYDKIEDPMGTTDGAEEGGGKTNQNESKISRRRFSTIVMEHWVGNTLYQLCLQILSKLWIKRQSSTEKETEDDNHNEESKDPLSAALRAIEKGMDRYLSKDWHVPGILSRSSSSSSFSADNRSPIKPTTAAAIAAAYSLPWKAMALAGYIMERLLVLSSPPSSPKAAASSSPSSSKSSSYASLTLPPTLSTTDYFTSHSHDDNYMKSLQVLCMLELSNACLTLFVGRVQTRVPPAIMNTAAVSTTTTTASNTAEEKNDNKKEKKSDNDNKHDDNKNASSSRNNSTAATINASIGKAYYHLETTSSRLSTKASNAGIVMTNSHWIHVVYYLNCIRQYPRLEKEHYNYNQIGTAAVADTIDHAAMSPNKRGTKRLHDTAIDSWESPLLPSTQQQRQEDKE